MLPGYDEKFSESDPRRSIYSLQYDREKETIYKLTEHEKEQEEKEFKDRIQNFPDTSSLINKDIDRREFYLD